MTKWSPVFGDKCIQHNSDGFPFEDVTCMYPVLKPFYVKTEINFDPAPIRNWMVANPSVPIIAVVLYAVFIVYGQQVYFKDRPAWNWRSIMALWNLGLSVFSFIGFIRVLPHLIHNFTNYTLKENFCNDPESHYGSGSTGLWLMLFILSKFPELIDTFFIVIHKKKLIFLHWYHHISVLLYCWHSLVTKNPVGIIFCVMNYAVHSFMYFYYFLMAVNKKPKFINPVFITVAQISQMVVGVAVTIISIYFLKFDKVTIANKGTENECNLKEQNVIAALIMYGSYLVLFLEFFLGRYFGTNSKRIKSKLGSSSMSNGVAVSKPKTTYSNRRKEE